MIKHVVSATLCGILLVSLNACSNKSKFKKTESGLEYKIIKDEKGGVLPKEGDIVSFHLFMHLGDSVWVDTRKMNNNQPIETPLPPPSFKGDWVEGLKLLTAGDSAEFLIPIDTLKKLSGGQLPEWMKAGQKLSVNVKLVSVKSQEEARKEQEQMSEKQNAIDEGILQDYFTANNLKPNKSPGGVYYIVEKEGTGPSPVRGQQVTINYTGKTLDGNTFDSNTDPKFGHVEPLSFVIGRGGMIPGFEEGVSVLKKGDKAKIFIPSAMAYGPANQPGIPANSVLMFDIEVTNVQNAMPEVQ